jgi:hypothetical protein
VALEEVLLHRPLGILAALMLLVVSVGMASAATPKTGSGDFDFTTSLVPATRDGQEGRIVYLRGVISGTNFEPGICNPFPAAVPVVGNKCLNFTKTQPVQPGEFLRAHNGQTAFTVCDCTIEGKTGTFTLKITYPNPNNITITHFTIQNAQGDLKGLQGHGTLNFTNGTYTLNYQL